MSQSPPEVLGIVCNPLDLPYRYQDFGKGPLRKVFREAADPSIVRYRDRYYLFASMSGGFWHSADLTSWTFVPTPGLAAGDYAPDVREVDGYLYVTASRKRDGSPVLRSKDPLVEGFHEVATSSFPYWDPNVFQDDDGRTYLYWGCSNSEPLRGVEIDPGTFSPIGSAVDLLEGEPEQHGWERPGDSNRTSPPVTLGEKISARLFGTHSTQPYIEGPWMTKHDGVYYLQYAGPGTEFNVYADGYYTASSPLGPFVYSPDSPFSSKPGGFITGAGHGSTFQDAFGNWWHAATMRVSVNHHFERRLGLFPAGFDEDGVLFCNQDFGDFPLRVPGRRVDPWTGTSTGWMLQSYRAHATASSSRPGHGPELATDEDIRTWWAADDARPGATLTLDLRTERTVHAIQINLADHEMTRSKPSRPFRDPTYERQAFRAVDRQDRPSRYVLESSLDGLSWTVLHDGHSDTSDAPHRLVVPPAPTQTRFVRITSISTPWDGVLAVSGLRVFGDDDRPAPAPVSAQAHRISRVDAHVRWNASPGADGYNVRYGRRPDRLYHSWQVWGTDTTELDLSTLDAGSDYWIAVDSFGPGGVSAGEVVAVRDAVGAAAS